MVLINAQTGEMEDVHERYKLAVKFYKLEKSELNNNYRGNEKHFKKLLQIL